MHTLNARSLQLQSRQAQLAPAQPVRYQSAAKSARHQRRSVASTRAAAQQQDYTQELRAAEKRWEGQIRDGKVKSISAKTAGELQKDGWVFLDVRPKEEVEKAGVAGAVHVPIYVADPGMDPLTLLKKASNLGLGGWWLGGTHMMPNKDFMKEVTTKIPRDARIIVACQKGLRSLSAAEQLSKTGYTTLAWVNGGLDTAKKTDLPVVGADDLRYGGIGGISQIFGWTDVQREKTVGFLGGSSGAIKLAVVVLLLDLAWIGYDKVVEYLAKNPPQ